MKQDCKFYSSNSNYARLPLKLHVVTLNKSENYQHHVTFAQKPGKQAQGEAIPSK